MAHASPAEANLCEGDRDYDTAVAEGCTTIAGNLTIENTSLTDLDGLSALTSVNHMVWIRGNDALENIDGLSALTTVRGSVWLVDNESLANLNGLSSLTSILSNLVISNNAALTNVDGLAALRSIPYSNLNIHKNGSLTNLDGLAALESIGGILAIYENAALTNVDGLASLTSVGELLLLHTNPDLCQHSVDKLLERITVEGNQIVNRNDGPCPPRCGDGNIDAGEICDDGNAADGDCCSATCQETAAPGATCRAATDECDIEETCDGTGAACPADERLPDWDADGFCDSIDTCPGRYDPAQTDSDADGLGDVCDLCTAGATATRRILRVTNFATYNAPSVAGAFLDGSDLLSTQHGDDKLVFKATLKFNTPVSPAPETNGFAFMLQDATGRRMMDLRLPSGAYDEPSESGWISSRKKRLYVSDAPMGDLVPKVLIRSRRKKPREIVVMVKAEKGSFADPNITLPLKATVSLDPADAMTSLCAEAEFPGPKPLPYCRMSGNGVAVICK
ncbi:MAG: hypothetical protein ABGY42_08850 [bacterium]